MDWWNFMMLMIPVCVLVGAFVLLRSAGRFSDAALLKIAGMIERTGVSERAAKVTAWFVFMALCAGVIFAASWRHNAREEAKKAQEKPAALMSSQVECACSLKAQCGGENGWYYCIDSTGNKKFSNKQ